MLFRIATNDKFENTNFRYFVIEPMKGTFILFSFKKYIQVDFL